jgi:ATP-binding cassette subfamily G (WHITE) protein 2
MVLELYRLYGGFFLSPAKLPKYFVWDDALSYINYVYVGISLNELQGLNLTCSLANQNNCVTAQGRITELGLDYVSVGACIGALIGMIVFFRFLAYIGVRYVKW